MLDPAPVRDGFERPAFQVLMVAFVAMQSVTCPVCGPSPAGYLFSQELLRQHWRAGHFDRRPLDTSKLPPARRIIGRGAGPKDDANTGYFGI